MKNDAKNLYFCESCGKSSTLYIMICPCGAIESYKKRDKDKPDNQFDNQLEMFLWIWNNRERKSQISGRDLTKVPEHLFLNMFAHVLSKAMNRYPKFKLLADNCYLIHPDEHELYDKGTIQQREDYCKKWNCSFDGIFAKAEELKKIYPK